MRTRVDNDISANGLGCAPPPPRWIFFFDFIGSFMGDFVSRPVRMMMMMMMASSRTELKETAHRAFEEKRITGRGGKS